MASTPADEVWQPLLAVANATGGQLRYLACDVTNEDDVAATFAKAEASIRYPLRGVVLCAGISGRCPAVEYSVSAFRKIMDVNVTGSFLCATAAARIMQRQGVSGSIVMFASMSGTNVNKVRSGKRWIRCTCADVDREWTPVRTTHQSPQCCNWLEIWLQNGATVRLIRRFESTRSLPVT